MRFSEILKPGKERIRALTDIATGDLALKCNDTAEVDEAAAALLVRSRRAKYATRVEVLKPIGPIDGQSIEPGLHSVIEVSSHQALSMERKGTGCPAPPIDTGLRFPHDAGPMVKFRVTPPKGQSHVWIGPLLETCAKGDVRELPEGLAKQYLDAKLITLAE